MTVKELIQQLVALDEHYEDAEVGSFTDWGFESFDNPEVIDYLDPPRVQLPWAVGELAPTTRPWRA
jgi:hypothetical protein